MLDASFHVVLRGNCWFEVEGSLKWAIAFTAALGAMLEVIDTSIVNVALTDIQATLRVTVSVA